MKSECGPLLLAIQALNVQAVKDMLEHDNAVNLRESMRGPADAKQLADGAWSYVLIKDEDGASLVTLGV